MVTIVLVWLTLVLSLLNISIAHVVRCCSVFLVLCSYITLSPKQHWNWNQSGNMCQDNLLVAWCPRLPHHSLVASCLQLQDYRIVAWWFLILDQLDLNVWSVLSSPLSFSILFLALSSRIDWRWPFFILHLTVVVFLVGWAESGNPLLDVLRGGCLAFSVFQASETLLLCDARKVFKLKGQKEAFDDLPLYRRVIWTIQYLISPRGVGWTHEPTSRLPPRSKHTRLFTFILEQFKWFCWYHFLYQLTRIPIYWRPSIPEKSILAGIYIFLWRQVYIYAAGINGYAALNLLWYAGTMAAVATGLFSSNEWPPLFGSLRDAYTVGRFWG